jgi:hypothetical protein
MLYPNAIQIDMHRRAIKVVRESTRTPELSIQMIAGKTTYEEKPRRRVTSASSFCFESRYRLAQPVSQTGLFYS